MAATSPNAYPYQRLDGMKKEIRLLRPADQVLPAPTTSLLQFEVITVSLLDEPTPVFNAISYAWGDDPAPTKAILDGRECLIPDSAGAALRGLLNAMAQNQMDYSTTIWIDAVCINQNDLVEKSQQVASMGSVFSSASCVLIWLGEDDGTAKSAIITMQALANYGLECTGDEQSLQRDADLPDARKPSLPYWDTSLPYGIDWDVAESTSYGCNMRDLESLLARKYFSRLWTFQEIALARQLILFVGTNRFEWTNFSFALRWARHTWNEFAHYLMDLDVFSVRTTYIREVHRLRQQESRGRLLDIDRFFKVIVSQKTSEPRDKVYAILGFIGDVGDTSASTPPFTMVDYNKAIVDVYRETFWLAIQHSSDPLYGLYICQSSCTPSSVQSSWPSWVPQFHLGDNLIHSPCRSALRKNRPAVVHVDPSKLGVLQLTGIVIDTIKHIWAPPLDLGHLTMFTGDPVYQQLLYKHFAHIWRKRIRGQAGFAWSKGVLLSLGSNLVCASYNNEDKQLEDLVAFLTECRKQCGATLMKIFCQ